MGCGGSKVDDQPLVILCRKRKELIKEASYHRTALAVAHLVYFQSLCDVGEAIQHFVDEEIVVGSSSSSPDSPVLTLPSDEGKPKKHKGSISSTSISHSIIEEGEERRELDEDTEDSHLHMSSGSESESGSEAGSDDHIQIDSTTEQELNQSTETFSSGYPTGYAPPGYPPGYPSGYLPDYPYAVGGWGFTSGENPNANRGMYFMKKSAPPSRPFIFQPENHRVEPSDSGFGNSGYFSNDGIDPFSPSRIGAPPIFIICKDWQEAMGRISGENVSNAMQGLHELWEKQEEEEQRVKAELEHRDAESDKRSMVSRGRSESGISALDDLKVDLDSMRKKLAEERGRRKETIKLVNRTSSNTLKAGLVSIFEELRKFTAEVILLDLS